MRMLFRQEAVNHQREAALGIPVKRRNRRISAIMVVLLISVIALSILLAQWKIVPGQSLIEWIALRVASKQSSS